MRLCPVVMPSGGQFSYKQQSDCEVRKEKDRTRDQLGMGMDAPESDYDYALWSKSRPFGGKRETERDRTANWGMTSHASGALSAKPIS